MPQNIRSYPQGTGQLAHAALGDAEQQAPSRATCVKKSVAKNSHAARLPLRLSVRMA